MSRPNFTAACAIVAASLAIASASGAQQMHMHMAGEPSARALTQIEQVRAAAARLASIDSASANG